MAPATGTPPDELHVYLHHPELDGEVLLRTSADDWTDDVEPIAVDRTAGRYEFLIKTEEPFVYYKALVREGAKERWAVGPDRLATTGSQEVRDYFPDFEGMPARFTDPEQVESDAGAWTYRVFLPPGYDENTLHRYPVLYMNDGHNLFFRAESAAGRQWGVQDTLARLIEMTTIEQILVVGIYPNDRMADYSRKNGANYRRFLRDGLKPHVDRTYRTLSGPEHTAIMGSSLGGVVAMQTAWESPEHFGMAGCLSASFGYDDELKRRVLEEPKPAIRVYLDSGWPRDNFEVTRDLRARLVRAGFEEGRDLLYFAFPGDRHSEVDWGDRCHVPFQFFFGQRPDARSLAGRHTSTTMSS